jgi:hypothetical protein
MKVKELFGDTNALCDKMIQVDGIMKPIQDAIDA